MMKEAIRKNGWRSVLYRIIRVVIVLGIAVAIMKLLISLKIEPERKQVVQTPPSVNIITALPESKVMEVEAYGTVVPRKSVKIAAEVSGRILDIHPFFIEGGMVAKGDLLVQIDPESYELEHSAARVRITQARVEIKNLNQEIQNLNQDVILSQSHLALVEKELKRVKTLTKNKFASQNSRDKAEQNYIQAKMQLQSLSNRLLLTDTAMEAKRSALAMAQVDFQRADLALKRTRIHSDFDGFVLEKKAEQGEYVSPGQSLGLIYEKGKIDVEIRIPIEKTRWLKGVFDTNMLPRVLVSMGSTNGRDVNPTWEGRVARLKAKIDERTRTLPMTVEIDSGSEASHPILGLKPGSFVKCTIIGETMDNIYVVPRYLLKTGDILFIVKDSRLVMKKVSILRKFEEQVFITQGLEPGDQIVSSPLPGALEGMELTIKENGN